MAIDVTVNGEARQLDDGATIAAVLATLGFGPDTPGIGVEVNSEFVPPAQHGKHTLEAGDVIEVVRFLGGG
jgi:sulfur carrier protein